MTTAAKEAYRLLHRGSIALAQVEEAIADAIDNEFVIKRFWKKISIGLKDQCWEWQAGTFTDGYGQFNIPGRPFNHPIRSHRFAKMLALNCLLRSDELVLHSCDNIRCCNQRHLFVGTCLENIQDRDRKGRHVPSPGERNGMAVLSRLQVIEMRALYKTGAFTQRQMAKAFGVCFQNVHLILCGKRWRCIPW